MVAPPPRGSGYVEATADIRCGTCDHLRGTLCRRWSNARVSPTHGCCDEWTNLAATMFRAKAEDWVQIGVSRRGTPKWRRGNEIRWQHEKPGVRNPIWSGRRRGADPATRPGVYYHVVPDDYQDGDDILSWDEYAERYGEGRPWKWEGDPGSVDSDIVSLHDDPEEAREFAEEYGGKILEVRVPEDVAEWGISGGTNSEGYPYIARRIPREWVRPHNPKPRYNPAEGDDYKGVPKAQEWRGQYGTHWMSPDEYLATVAEGFGQSQAEVEEQAFSNEREKLRQRMVAGLPIDPAWIEYNVDTGKMRGQEGRNRAIVARELGIEHVPVVIAYTDLDGDSVDPDKYQPPDRGEMLEAVTQKWKDLTQDPGTIEALVDFYRRHKDLDSPSKWPDGSYEELERVLPEWNPVQAWYKMQDGTRGLWRKAHYYLFEKPTWDMQKAWQPYEGPRHGRGWWSDRTGEVRYQDEKPSEREEKFPTVRTVEEVGGEWLPTSQEFERSRLHQSRLHQYLEEEAWSQDRKREVLGDLHRAPTTDVAQRLVGTDPAQNLSQAQARVSKRIQQVVRESARYMDTDNGPWGLFRVAEEGQKIGDGPKPIRRTFVSWVVDSAGGGTSGLWAWASARFSNENVPTSLFNSLARNVRDGNEIENYRLTPEIAAEFEQHARLAQDFARAHDPTYDPNTDTVQMWRAVNLNRQQAEAVQNSRIDGTPVRVRHRTLESWTARPQVTFDFGNHAFAARVPVSAIISSWSVNETLQEDEAEYVVAMPMGEYAYRPGEILNLGTEREAYFRVGDTVRKQWEAAARPEWDKAATEVEKEIAPQRENALATLSEIAKKGSRAAAQFLSEWYRFAEADERRKAEGRAMTNEEAQEAAVSFNSAKNYLLEEFRLTDDLALDKAISFMSRETVRLTRRP